MAGAAIGEAAAQIVTRRLRPLRASLNGDIERGVGSLNATFSDRPNPDWSRRSSILIQHGCRQFHIICGFEVDMEAKVINFENPAIQFLMVRLILKLRGRPGSKPPPPPGRTRAA